MNEETPNENVVPMFFPLFFSNDTRKCCAKKCIFKKPPRYAQKWSPQIDSASFILNIPFSFPSDQLPSRPSLAYRPLTYCDGNGTYALTATIWFWIVLHIVDTYRWCGFPCVWILCAVSMPIRMWICGDIDRIVVYWTGSVWLLGRKMHEI